MIVSRSQNRALSQSPGRAGRRDMNTTLASIFDLSPSEKLQLVEDLWDDLDAALRAASAATRP